MFRDRISSLSGAVFALCAFGVCLEPAAAESPMWDQAPRWECLQRDFQAACAGGLGPECQTNPVRRPETLILDFPENVVVRDSGASTSYVPIAGKTTDRRRRISFVLYGQGGDTMLHYAGGDAVSTSLPPKGGSVSLKFYSCAPALE